MTLQKKTDDKTTKKLSPEADLVRRFMRYLKLDRNYSVNTQEAYSHDLRYFMRFLHEHGLSPLEVKLEDLEQFAASLHEFNLGARTQSRILFGVRSFYRYLTLDGYLEVDPTELLESPILPKHLPTYLSTEEVDRLEDSIDLETNEGQRNRAIIETLFSCGLRVSALLLWTACLGADEPQTVGSKPRRAFHPRHRQGRQGAARAHLRPRHP